MADGCVMTAYQSPNSRDAFRFFRKALRLVVEPAFVAIVMFFLEVPWWGFVVLIVLWLPLARVRVRELRDEWRG